MTYTLSAEDTDSHLTVPAEVIDLGRHNPHDDPTTVIPRSFLNRPSLEDTERMELPPRVGIVLPPLPAVDLAKTEQLDLLGSFGVEPVGYVGRHRAPDDEPAVIGGAPTWRWPSLIAKLLRRGGAR